MIIFSTSETAIARIAEAGDDVAVFVKVTVEGGGVNGGFAKIPEQSAESLRRSESVDKAKVLCAALLQQLAGGDGAAGGGEHWVDDEHFKPAQARREFFQIPFGLEGGVVAGNAEVANTGLGEDLICERDESLPCAEDRDEKDFARRHDGGRGTERGAHAFLFGGQTGGGFVQEMQTELAKGAAKLGVQRGFVAQDGEASLREGMLDEMNVFQKTIGQKDGARCSRANQAGAKWD